MERGLTDHIEDSKKGCAIEVMSTLLYVWLCVGVVLNCVVEALKKHNSICAHGIYCAAAVGSTAVASEGTILGSAEK